jgi:hypothetical protein
MQALRNQLTSFYPHTQGGSMHVFGYLVAGTLEIFPNDEDLTKVEEVIDDFISSV